jgi:hypothetical protein
MRYRPKRENYPIGQFGENDYQEMLERYCTYLENQNKQLRIGGVSCSAYKDELIKKTESMIWFARENYNKEYYEGVLNAMRNLQVHIKKMYEKHYS